ncbi:dipeptide epimerase [Flavimarina sp. Hel_I_48]|uniref:dipeptide epimerase n=1 Tax=Flavimarina sp. Hel_I_48 TaxID=1392488 RepID=UPI0004DFCCCA|nr:dipeptide epimerase [Flavimarina sp. Hel_I_48]
MQITLKKYTLALKHTFSISRESHDFQDTLIVSLRDQGNIGHGEATSNPYYNITVKSMMEEIEQNRTQIEAYSFKKPEDFYSFLKTLKLSNFALCALDLAANDLYGKIQRKPLYELWETTTAQYPKTNYTIGLDTVEKMVEKMQELPWPLYKIKLGTEDDVAIISELRKHTDAVFRVDANCAWGPEQTIENAPILKEMGVEFIEQPLKADNWEDMKRVIKESALPIIADESCIVPEDVARCAGHFTGINIKLTKCGGLTPARKMIAEAKQKGLKVMVGCMTESSVGISAIAQLLPQLDFVDMDGAMLLREDIAKGAEIKDGGEVVFPQLGGCGITLF